MLKHHELELNLAVCGIDEAGRGSCVGSVFASAVILPHDYFNADLDDSKKLSRIKREKLYDEIIKESITYAISSSNQDIVDNINILQATFKSMDESVKKLSFGADVLLVDGNRFIKNYPISHICVIKGDGIYYNIAAASILSKVSKDREMDELHKIHPEYNWCNNAGYLTKEHYNAVLKYGLTKYHRKTYKKIYK